MPRSPKTPKASDGAKPYVRSPATPPPTSQDTDQPTRGANKSSARKRDPDLKSKAWTSEEYVQLFEKVAKAGMGRETWKGAVEGRSADQCYFTWMTVAPFVKKALSEKAKR